MFQLQTKKMWMSVVIGMCITSTAADFDLSWYTIDGGGETFSTGGSFVLGGTIGQPDASSFSRPMTDASGRFELVGGFWAGVGAGEPCFGDLDGDGDVDLADLAQLLANYGETSGMTYADGDIEPPGGDGDVDLADLAALLGVYGDACP